MLKRFEQELARTTAQNLAIGVGNRTDAHLAGAHGPRHRPGSEVITHPNTFFATAEPSLDRGRTAVLR